MYNMNSIYNPDHQQVLEYHKKLLKKAEQEQLVHSVEPKLKRSLPSFRNLLRLMVSVRHAHKMVPPTRTPSAQL